VMISLDEYSRQDTEPVIMRSASDLLNAAAIDAARRSTFQTEIVGCRPIKSKAVYVEEFMSQ